MTDTELRLRALLGQFVGSHEEAQRLRYMEDRGCYCALCMMADTLDIPSIHSTFPLEDAMAIILREMEPTEQVQP